MQTWLLALVVALGMAGCGGGAAGSAASPSTPATGAPPTVTTAARSPAAAAKKPDLPANAIRRSIVRDLLAQGPGAFLQRIAVDDQPVFVGGKFHGFRITALRGDMWQGVDLKPGDVVIGVNGFPVEHPEEALEAFKSLAVSSELKVMYERDGVPRELKYAIVDD
jgi:type II secretory pathway component PulC